MEGLGPWLDSMSYRDYLLRELKLHPGVADQVDPVLAIANYGFGCDVISAYAAYLLQLPGMKGYFMADTYDLSADQDHELPGRQYHLCAVYRQVPDSGCHSRRRVGECRARQDRLRRARQGRRADAAAARRHGHRRTARRRRCPGVVPARWAGGTGALAHGGDFRQRARWRAESSPTCPGRCAATTRSSITAPCSWPMSPSTTGASCTGSASARGAGTTASVSSAASVRP